jgi:hypothetical protein
MNKILLDDKTCSICLEQFKNKVILNCKHEYCKDCIIEWATYYKNNCPLCREPIKIIEERVKCSIKKSCICVSFFTSFTLLILHTFNIL